MFLGSLTWHFPNPKTWRIHGGRKTIVADKQKKITPSSSDKTLIGPAHSPGNKGAGPPRQKVQTERLIGPPTPESGHPARAASPVHTLLSPTDIPKRASPARRFGNDFYLEFLNFALFFHTTYPRNIKTLYHYILYVFFSSATLCFVISGPSPRQLLL